MRPDYLLVDGKQSLPAQFFRSKRIAAEIPPQQRTVIKGDQLCFFFSIAAASILAKVARDVIMMNSTKTIRSMARPLIRDTPVQPTLKRYGASGHRRFIEKVLNPCAIFAFEMFDANLTLFPSIAKSE